MQQNMNLHFRIPLPYEHVADYQTEIIMGRWKRNCPQNRAVETIVRFALLMMAYI